MGDGEGEPEAELQVPDFGYWLTTPRGHFLAKDGPKRRSARLTVLRRISEYVTPPLKRLADRRLFRRSKISLPLSSHYTQLFR
ncbi:hypothetical protein CROQUDRAFT_95204 [Cronartium quercuum f. sp. fusiforme G11]|uniref:Uncharacterized protein n=1 Tax=Cronartium quercuum f. sp. fusiforme G11 TaxID=708437 RepID=A0A9P6TB64_9BASI|nr:hypothetical protein CROQUDRAFT_95204 [Cronartium quercuum f. sp. fusiforme G11]